MSDKDNNKTTTLLPKPEWDLLLSAAQKNLPDKIRHMIQVQGVDPSHANGVGQSALHIACLWGHVPCVTALLELGANANAANSLTAATPLIMTMQSRKTNVDTKTTVVRALLQHGANPAQADAYGQTAVDYAPAADVPPQHVLVTELLAPTVPLIFQAIDNVNAGQVAELLSLQQQQEQQDDNHHVVNGTHRSVTPLAHAVTKLAQQVVQLSDLNMNDDGDDDDDNKNNSSSSSTTTTTDTMIQIIHHLLNADAKMEVSSSDETTTAPALLPGKTMMPMPDNIMDNNNDKEPALFVLLQACRDWLLQNNKNKNTTTHKKIPPLLTQVTRRIMQAPSTPRLTTEQLASLWHTAARRGQLAVLQFLHDDLSGDNGSCWPGGNNNNIDGSLINATNRQGMTALQFGARSGKVAVVQWLLQQDEIQIHHQDARGQTARQAALANQHDEIVQLLDAAGANKEE